MIELDWGDAHERVLIWAFYDGWTAKDFYNAVMASEKILKNRSHRLPVHIILDVQHTNDTPNNMLTLARYAIKHATTTRHKGLIIVINPSPLWLELYNILQPMIPHTLQVSFAKDANLAYEMISDADTGFAKG